MRNFNIHALIIIFALITIPTLAQKAPSWSWPQCRNYNGSSPEQPATIYLGDQGTFGHDSWADVDTKWPKWCVVISKNTDLTTGALSGSWSSYSNVQHKTNTSPRFNSTGTWYWGMKVEYTDAGGTTGWYCNNNTAWANMYGSPTSNLTITVTALSDPSSQTAVASSNTQINLSWTKWNDKNVMIVRRLTSAAPSNAPTQGTAYSPGSTLGTGTVVYNSNGTSFNNTGLTPGTDYTYVFYSENYSYYSNGATSSATTTAVSSSSDYFRSKQTGGWNTASNWESSDNGSSNWITGTLVPGSSAASITVQNGHNITLDANDVTVTGLIINSGATFTASDATARVLTITKSTSGSATTLSNSGTWANGSGGSTVVFTGAPSGVDATHTISGTIAFQNVTIIKTGGSSNVGASFGANSSVSGTLEIGTGGFVSTAPPTSFYGSSAILKFNQGSGATYDVNTADYTWSTTVIPNYITISSGTVNLKNARTASGNLLIDGGTLTLNAGLTIQGNWTRTSGTFTPNSQIVTLSGTTNTIINTATDANLYDLVVSKTGGAYVTMDNNLTVSHNLTISSGAILKVPSAKSLTVSGTLTNSAGVTGLVLESGSSLITSSAVSATVKRTIDAANWSNNATGWHILSSPVSAQSFQPSFVSDPPSAANEDFYLWDETTNYWINSKFGASAPYTFNSVAFGATFVVGKGYLAAYASTSTKEFTGTLNVANVTKTLTYTGTTYRKGWNLLGNPFTSGIKWNVTTWGATNVSGVAKIVKSTDGSYQDISADGYIPALNGFFVHTSVNNTSITIPASAKEHNGTWYKAEDIKQFTLTAKDIEGQTAQSSNIRINPEATNDFDMLYDGEFMALYAPKFYSICGQNQLSTNSLPEITNETIIDFGFAKNNGTLYSIEASELESLNATVYLTDLKTGTVQNLNINPVYSFSAAEGDQTNRFKLSFGSVGINSPENNNTGIYAYGNKLCIQNPGNATLEVYNMAGQQILSQQISSTSLYQTGLTGSTGYYVVRLVNAGNVRVSKVFVQ